MTVTWAGHRLPTPRPIHRPQIPPPAQVLVRALAPRLLAITRMVVAGERARAMGRQDQPATTQPASAEPASRLPRLLPASRAAVARPQLAQPGQSGQSAPVFRRVTAVVDERLTAEGNQPTNHAIGERQLAQQVEQVETLVRNLTTWSRQQFDPKKLADSTYQTMVRRLVRERERLGR